MTYQHDFHAHAERTQVESITAFLISQQYPECDPTLPAREQVRALLAAEWLDDGWRDRVRDHRHNARPRGTWEGCEYHEIVVALDTPAGHFDAEFTLAELDAWLAEDDWL